MEIARRHGLHVVEDSAQAVAAEYDGRCVGSFGAVGCFSLHPLKTLNAIGDAGILTTDDADLYERLILLRNHGLKSRAECIAFSINSRLDTIQAAALLVKFKYLDGWTEARRANAAFYQEQLEGIPGLRVPQDRDIERAVYHTFIVQAERRDDLKQYLTDHGIGTAIHYPAPIHVQPAAAYLEYKRGDFPVTERQAERILTLPIYPELTRDDLETVASTIRAFYEGQ